MFLNPIWSLLLLGVIVAVYFVYMRPWLKAHFSETYVEFDSFWAKVWYIITKFKKTLTVLVGILITAAPDLLVQVAPLDFSKILPEPWPAFVGPICLGIITVMKRVETPGNS